MYEFSPFNQILFSLSDVSNIFNDSIWIIYICLIHFCFNVNSNIIIKYI